MSAFTDNMSGLNNGFGTENTAIEYAFSVVDEARSPVARRGGSLVVCPAAEISPGEKRIVQADGFSIGVFNIKGKFFAIKNVCPHIGAPLCQGHIQTTHRPSDVQTFDPAFEGRIIRCPWHGWEFDIVTGKGLYDRQGRVATYPVEVDEAGNLVVRL